MNRPSWDDYFFRIAAEVATRATCPRAAIGCVIVHPRTRRILATGYNGGASGEAHCDDVGCTILANHCVRAVHAEVNAAHQTARHPGLAYAGLVAYVVGGREVCSHCARELYAVGVREVFSREAVPTLDGLTREIRTWQAATFPQATPSSVAEHLRREAEELAGEPSDPEEMADIFHLLVASAEANGYDLVDVVSTKFAINRARAWGKPDGAGVVEHLREVTA